MKSEEIISYLPYSRPFLFVDSVTITGENSLEGEYKFREDEFFYEGHFIRKGEKGFIEKFPVTPGVILIETMAQIGVVCMGIYLLREKLASGNLPEFVMSSAEVEYFLTVFPGEKVKVFSEKIYFRFGKLKCNVKMKNEKNELVCKSIISGMIINFQPGS